MTQLPLPSLTLRQFSGAEQDLFILWQWRNDVAVRKWQNLGIVSYDGFARSLKPFNVLIAEVNGTPIGYAQLEPIGNYANTFVMIDKDHRGRGYGPQLAKLAAEWAVKRLMIAFVRVMPDNRVALNALKSVGFTHTDTQDGKLVMTYGRA